MKRPWDLSVRTSAPAERTKINTRLKTEAGLLRQPFCHSTVHRLIVALVKAVYQHKTSTVIQAVRLICAIWHYLKAKSTH